LIADTASQSLPAYEQDEAGIIFFVRLTPKSGQNNLSGLEIYSGRLRAKIRVSAPPEYGKANAALVATIAKQLDVPKSAVSVVAGTTSRLKSVFIRGEPGKLASKIEAILADFKG
jgi:uncharacterized protein (TIGR00251 family)